MKLPYNPFAKAIEPGLFRRMDELKQVCEPLAKNGCHLALDLTEVTFADESGVTLLADLRTRRVKLLSAMPFVEEQLKSASLTS